MAAGALCLYFEGKRFELDVQDTKDVEDLKLQIMSLIDRHVDEFDVFSSAVMGALGSECDIESALQSTAYLAVHLKSPRAGLTNFDKTADATYDDIARSLIAETCTRTVLSDKCVAQPAFSMIVAATTSPSASSGVLLCGGCATTCVPPGAAVPAQLPLSGESIGFACMCNSRGPGACLFESKYGINADMLTGPIGDSLYEVLASECAKQQQTACVGTIASVEMAAHRSQADGIRKMAERLRGLTSHINLYRDSNTLRRALSTIPVAMLHQRAWQSIHDSEDESSDADYKEELLHQLALWFKREFFRWTNSVACGACNSSNTACVGATAPSPEERLGLAGVTEIHRCNSCSTDNRFPRYNHPGMLLDWRQGRCGEWANCFTLCCLALGFVARHVTDWTDHVWTEVWSEHRKKWLHVDSCECAIDAPLVYESGWGKKLSYVIAAGLDEIVDVTRRYTKRLDEVLTRRTQLPEESLRKLLDVYDKAQFLKCHSKNTNIQAQWSVLQRRRAAEERFLQANVAFDDGIRHTEELSGRISGSLQWRAERKELGAHDSASLQRSTAATVTFGWQICHEICLKANDGVSVEAVKDLHALAGFGNQLLAVSNTHGIIYAATGKSHAGWKKLNVVDKEGHAVETSKYLALCGDAKSMTFHGMTKSHLDKVFYDSASRKWTLENLESLADIPTSSDDDERAGYGLAARNNGDFIVLSDQKLLHTKPVRVIASAPHCAFMTLLDDSIPLAFQANVEGPKAASDSDPVVISGHVSVCVRLPREKQRAVAISAGSSMPITLTVPITTPTHHGFDLKFNRNLTKEWPNGWVLLRLFGQPSAAFIEHSMDLYELTCLNESTWQLSFPRHKTPKRAGMYEVVFFTDVGFESQNFKGPAIVFHNPATVTEEPAMTWLPICPASNVTAMCTAGDAVYAATRSGELWNIDVSQIRHAVHDLGIEALPNPPSDSTKSAAAITTTSGAFDVKAAVARLFKQLTVGCEKAAGTCTNPHCAKNNACGIVAANAAAVMAYKLAAAQDESVFCK